jgi:hypothetical protein
MDTPAAREADQPPARPTGPTELTATEPRPTPARTGTPLPSSLADELRTSVYLLGGALGTMTLLAFVLLLATHWLAR